jgi:hypothetical protein
MWHYLGLLSVLILFIVQEKWKAAQNKLVGIAKASAEAMSSYSFYLHFCLFP